MTSAPNAPDRIQQLVALWNENYPPGTPVKITNGVGVEIATVTTSPAMIFAKSMAVVWIKGVVGHVDLNKLVVSL
ncbi:MAG: hypothetical protein WC762_02980 [Methylobacter sp.]|jgi:hypothetical protein